MTPAKCTTAATLTIKDCDGSPAELTLDAAVTQPLIIKIAGVVQLDMYHISGLQKKVTYFSQEMRFAKF